MPFSTGLESWKVMALCSVLVLLLLGTVPSPHSHDKFLFGPGDYQTSGSFVPGGAYAGSHWLDPGDKQFSIGSQDRDDGKPGTFVSKPFIVPAKLSCFVSGYPNQTGNAMYLQTEGAQARLNLGFRTDPGEEWQPFSWTLPASWQGHSVRLVAENHSIAFRGWMGLTLPRGEPQSVMVADSFLQTLFLMFRICVEAVWFLIPGLAIAFWVQSRLALDTVRFVSCSLLGSAAVGYLAFWPYLLGPLVGKRVALAILTLAVVSLLRAVFRLHLDRTLLRAFFVCAGLMILVTTFYSAIGFAYKRSDNAGIQAERRIAWPMTVDNILPNILADDLYFGKPFRPFLLIDWKSSDRPPLQTAIVLLQRPLWLARQSTFDYQILATFLQSMWTASLWLMLRTLAVSRRMAAVVFGFCLFSGFFVLHTFFVWPKLLAAALFILAVVNLRFAEGRVEYCDRVDTLIGGAAIGLAMLSHGGIAFSVIGLAIVLLAYRRLPRLRVSAWGLAALFLLLFPWNAYQKWFDPPGDRLLKWHLAGVIDRDNRSFRQALIDAYTKVPVSQIVVNKLANARELVGPSPWEDLRQARATGASQSKRLLHWYKVGTFFFLFQMLGVLDLGFVAFLWARSAPGSTAPNPLLPALQRLLLLAIVSLVVWCLLIYIPGSTVIHAGSYGTVMLLFMVLSLSLMSIAPRLTYVLLAVQAVFLFPLFALTDAFLKSRPATVFANGADLGMMSLAVVSLGALVGLVVRYGGLEESHTLEQASVFPTSAEQPA